MASLAKRNFRSELQSHDWDFVGRNGQNGLNKYHWYPARFLDDVPSMFIGYFSQPGDVVLDLFCGSGTTLLAAKRLGRSTLGVDTNPAAVLISKSKLVYFDAALFKDYCNRVLLSASELLLEAKYLPIPNSAENAAWYHEDTLRELVSIWEAIRSMGPDDTYADVSLVAFSSILRFACSQDKHWGWICDNVKPKTLYYRPALTIFEAKLREYGSERERLLKESPRVGDNCRSRVLYGDSGRVLRSEAAESVDLIVTSPPYYGMTDYARAQRLSFLWFENWDLEESRAFETGARFKRRRHTSHADFLAELKSSFEEAYRVLKTGGYCCIVIGESPKRASTLDEFEKVLMESGFSVEETFDRNVPVQRSMLPQLTKERIIVARKAELVD